MRLGVRSKRGLGALLLVLMAGGLLVFSAGLSGASRFEPPTAAAFESLLGDALGLPAQVGAVSFDLLRLAVIVEDVDVQLGSWRLRAARVHIRPDWMAAMGGQLRPYAWSERFELLADASDGAGAARRLPELFDVLGIPDAHIRLRGGELRTREGAGLLGAMAFEVVERDGDASIRLRARQGANGRLDARGFVTAAGHLVVDAYLDRLGTPQAAPWIAQLGGGEGAGLGLPPLAGDASGRWHIDVGHRGSRHEFAFELRAWEPPARAAARPQAVSRFDLAGRLELAPGDHARIVPGSHVELSAQAERLRVRSEGSAPWLVSGPFRIEAEPFGPWEHPFLVVQAAFDDAHLELPRGIRKPAGERGRLALVHGKVPGDPVHTRFRIDLSALDLVGDVTRERGLVASSGWLPVAQLGDVLPQLAQRATGGHVRVRSLEASSLAAFEAEIEFAGADWSGARMPFPVSGLSGSLHLTATSVEARELTASFADVPVRLALAARRADAAEAPWHLSFEADVDDVELPQAAPTPAAPEVSGSGVAMPPELVGIAQQQLPFLRDLGVTTRVEIERGRLRCARLRTRGETLRQIEVDMALRSLRLDLANVSFVRRGIRRSYQGSIDLNPLLPEVHIAALD